uniref:NADH-ubiquinone oxidoreductase chain 6 n=1 Tax=Carcinochelis bannaensis TaxID=2126074 RepID=A0A343W8P7_9HEMI|nr:NADH dehydrogenase subunit 6 [Carcinochelis bannaensis]AVZ00737.1 NADH dehydrogenase subunit 6 [Carcinochelis bannaensis]
MVFMMFISWMTSILFLIMKHPLSMGIMLIIQTIIIAITTGLMINMFWFSYILLMTILSGMLVLFIYMASVASNEKFKTSWTLIFISTTMIMTGMLSILWMDQMSTSNIWSSKASEWSNLSASVSLSNFFMNYNMSITLFLVCYLLMTMIVINKIVNVLEGPLRMKN